MAFKKVSRLPAVLSRTALSRSTLYLKMAEGTFPKPIKISKRAVAWPEEWIDAWLEEQATNGEAA